MKTKQIPDWLAILLTESEGVQASYTFGGLVGKNEIEVIEDDEGIEEFMIIAQGDNDDWLLLSEGNDGVIYWSDGKEVEVFAASEKEFKVAIAREEVWDSLAENMPVGRKVGLGIILKKITDDNEELTLGMRGESRDSAMVIQGEIREDEMLSDALERELKESLEITDFEMMDVVDDGGEMETDKGAMPLFTAVVKVEGFEPDEVIHDARIGWITTDKKPKLVN